MTFRRRAVLALLTALFALLLSASASAEVIITSAADEPDAVAGGVCETAAGGCTLRAAIEVANTAGTAQDVFFNNPPFNGQAGSTIVLTSPLPAIKAPISLIAGRVGSPSKPAAGVSGPTGNFGITVEADGVTIRNISVTGALTGINVINKSENFTATGNWIGVKLDGTAGANNTGIFIDPESDGAAIGTTTGPPEFVQPNVIAGNNNEGLDIEGASNAVIINNYFGVAPDGTTQMANAKNIEITDSTSVPGFPAENNEIGNTIEGAALTSAACDGGCNVISGATGTAIDLEGSGLGEEPASGPTTVHGNYVGLGADGTTVLANGVFDILVGAADDATIGGESSGDANYIAGGGNGIYHEEGEGFEALGNVIGVNAAEVAVASPSAAGIFVYSPATVDAPLVEGNLIRMDGGFGIEQTFGGAVIAENLLVGGTAGIYAKGLAPAVGNLIEDNLTFEAEENGILIEGDLNQVLGNEVVLSEEAGIKIRQAGPPFTSPTTENLIGGNTADDENLIFASGGDAIEIVNLEGSQNEIARNRGSDNGGLFIDLLAFEPGTEPNGPNGGIKPPVISTAEKSEAAGSAQPGATVRVFRKASAEPGELQSFLGEAVANGSGDWKVDYPVIGGGSIVAATQTSAAGGTSEISTTTTPPDPAIVVDPADKKDKDVSSKPDDKPDCKGKAAKCPPSEELQTTIKKAKISGTTAKFTFSSKEKGAKFECKLDKKKFKACKSPKTYKKLKPGKHVFKVRAVKGKNVDPTPAKRKFKVLA